MNEKIATSLQTFPKLVIFVMLLCICFHLWCAFSAPAYIHYCTSYFVAIEIWFLGLIGLALWLISRAFHTGRFITLWTGFIGFLVLGSTTFNGYFFWCWYATGTPYLCLGHPVA